ncbi:MAG: hypothetical protein U0O33_11930 [Blautia sp.]
MKYQYVPYDGAFYATMLRRDVNSGNLMWDNAKGRSVLVVQCPYGDNPFEKVREICNALEKTELEPDNFIEVLPDIWTRMVTAVQKVREKGCPMRGEASTYAIFCCEEKEDVCILYAPQTEKKSKIDIPAEISAIIKKETVEVRKGFLSRRTEQVDTGFYSINFPNGGIPGYYDGDLMYFVGKLQIPITRQMLENKKIYIKTNIKPDIKSTNRGLNLKLM